MGYNQHAGVGEETTWGTIVARNKFAKVMEGSFLEHIADRDTSAKLSANIGADAETVFDRAQRGEGKLIIPASYDDGLFAKVLKHLMGLLATSGAGPYTHTFTRKVGPPFAAGAVSTATSLTVELNYEFPDAGPIEARLLAGAAVTRGMLSWNAGEELKIDADFMGKEVTQAVKSGALTFPDYDAYEMKYSQVGVAVDGVQFGSVISGFDLTIDNRTEQRIRLGSVTTQRPIRRGKAGISGTIRMDWEATPAAKTLWDKFKAKTASEVIVTLTGPTNYSMVVTMSNLQWTGSNASPEEGQLQSVEFPFIALHHSANTAVKIVLQNQTATV